jgi:hypothetical protein
MYSENIAYASGVNTIFQPYVAKSTNGGINWSFTNFYLNGNEGNLSDIKFISENTGFASSRVFDGQGGISRTTDGGANWTTQLFPQHLHSIDFNGMNTGYCVGLFGLILKTTDGGSSWESQNGTSVTLMSVHFTDSITGYAAGNLGTIIKTTNGGLSALNGTGEFIPDRYILYQNYPNPFNPSTHFEFGISKLGFVSLKLYNALGKEVAVLVNEIKPAGNYNYQFSADNYQLSSGIYFYSLFIDGNKVDTKRMLLLK